MPVPSFSLLPPVPASVSLCCSGTTLKTEEAQSEEDSLQRLTAVSEGSLPLFFTETIHLKCSKAPPRQKISDRQTAKTAPKPLDTGSCLSVGWIELYYWWPYVCVRNFRSVAQTDSKITHPACPVSQRKFWVSCNYFLRKWGCRSENARTRVRLLHDTCKHKTPFGKDVPVWFWQTNTKQREQDQEVSQLPFVRTAMRRVRPVAAAVPACNVGSVSVRRYMLADR